MAATEKPLSPGKGQRRHQNFQHPPNSFSSREGQGSNTLFEVARIFRSNGLNVLPANGQMKTFRNKATGHKWQMYQTKAPNEKQLAEMFGDPEIDAVCLVGGATSGGLEVLDFDLWGIDFGKWKEYVNDLSPGLIEKLITENTVSDGLHAFYRCPEINESKRKEPLTYKNIKVPCKAEWVFDRYLMPYRKANIPKKDLAAVPKKYSKDCKCIETLDGIFVRITTIERLGANVLIMCSPSPGYDFLDGISARTFNPPVISLEERQILISAAKAVSDPPLVIPFSKTSPKKSWDYEGLSPAEHYNQSVSSEDIIDMLQEQGSKIYKRYDDKIHLTRPGKDAGVGGTLFFNQGIPIFSPLSSNWSGFEPDKGHSPFQVRANLLHNGDYSECARTLVQEGYGADAVKTIHIDYDKDPSQSIIDQTQKLEWGEPLTYGPLPEVTEDMMPISLWDFAQNAAKSIQVPLSTAALYTVGAAFAAVMQRWEVCDPTTGHVEQLQAYVAQLARPGSRKTSIVRACLKPLFDFQKRLENNSAVLADLIKPEIKILDFKIKRYEKMIGKKGQSDDDLVGKINEVEKKRDELIDRMKVQRLIVRNITQEKAAMHLSDNHECLTFASSESDFMRVLFGGYHKGAGQVPDFMLAGVDGEPCSYERVSRDPIYLDHPLICILTAFQVKLLRKMRTDHEGVVQGFFERFWVSTAPDLIGHRQMRGAKIDDDAVEEYYLLMEMMLRLPYPSGGKLWQIEASEGAIEELEKFFNYWEPRLQEGREYARYGGLVSKCEGKVWALAALFHIIENAYILASKIKFKLETGCFNDTKTEEDPLGGKLISRESAKMATKFLSVFIRHTFLFLDLLENNDTFVLSSRILDYMARKKLNTITVRELYRAFNNDGKIQTREDLDAPLADLENSNCIQKFQVKRNGSTGRPSEVVVINPKLLENGSGRAF